MTALHKLSAAAVLLLAGMTLTACDDAAGQGEGENQAVETGVRLSA